MKSNLHKTIMCRVYYSYTLNFLSEPMLWQGFVFGACIALFGRLTHVAAIAHNIGATRISDAPNYIIQSFIQAMHNGEVLTVLVVLFILMLSAKFFYRAGQVLVAGGELRTS